ncbi:monocarboxylate transporter 10 [Lucilia cuprina]|uniref:monocarboxylate transporter 10 n=1 Tax=Lucilia cuprina TaxID=7375 RepID=UPI001F0513B1|nr:monocarboxylate transporter 10 [Lucilia cuprina]XP_046805140.1 monocarboxylate transporter 10 [Lucilia cuprina]XP_046805141.1 monocarboxylate transporter 10 [Lucilia cuprina]
MTENEPLNEKSSHTNGQIVNSDQHNRLTNGNCQPIINGQYSKETTNGVSSVQHKTCNNKKCKNNSNSPTEVHIEAPCCRDIHGKEPPDGGMRAWLVMVSAFLCNGVIFGIINTYGVIHSLLTDRLEEQGDKDASSKAALVGSLTIGTTFLLSPVAGCLTDKIGLRLTTLIGGLLSSGGLLLSSFSTENIGALYITYGLMFGFGAALAYTPTLAILGHYFKRYLGKVSGFVTAGSSVFTVILPPGLDYLIKGYGLEVTLRIMSLISAFIIICSFVYKPLHPPPEPPKNKPGRSKANMLLRSIINVDIWKKKKYVIWALCVPLALFGYFVPYVHMMKFVQTVFPGKSENLPVMCIGITSGLGRLIFGAIADLPGVNRIYLQQLSLVCIGVVTLLLPLTSSYILLIVFSLIMGLFDGCFISLLGPIAYEICGPSGATQAIGFLLGLSSIPLTVGPPIAGRIYDELGSYTLPLILAGIPPIVGSAVLFLMRFVKDESPLKVNNGTVAINKSGNGTTGSEEDEDVEKNIESKQIVPLMNGHSKVTVNGNGSVEHRQTNSHESTTTNGKARLADSESLTDALPTYNECVH